MPNRNQNRDDQFHIPKKEIQRWITDGFESETIEFAQKFGAYLVDQRLTTSQIRNIFGEVKRIQGLVQTREQLQKHRKDFLMLRPKMAYAAKRAGSRGIEALKEALEIAHTAVDLNSPRQFENFVDFFEAILAYHKAEGGRD